MFTKTVVTALVAVCLTGYAQQSIHLINNDHFYPTITDNLEQNLPGVALSAIYNIEEVDNTIVFEGKSSYQLDETRAIDLLLESVARAEDNNQRNGILLEIGNKYFDRKDYDNAKRFYNQIHHTYLSDNYNHRVNFNLGYIHLLDKDFERSESYLDKVVTSRNEYTQDAQYYIGINQYYLNKVEDAIKNFEKVDDHPRYGNLIPFYLSQIYFKDKEYDKVIAYGEQRLNSKQLKNKGQIHKMLGLSYLAQENDQKALEHLQAFADATPKLSENEFYQIGLLQYRAGKTENASENLKELAHQETETGQMANYLLGAIALKEGQKQDARSAFKQASKLDYFEDIKSEANFLYYKLSADLGEERAAINGLVDVSESNAYYKDAQNLLAQILVRSSDHKIALSTIEKLPAKSPQILGTYQELSYDYGVQLIENGQQNEALPYFRAASETPGSTQTKNQSQFWTGYILDMNGSENESRSYLENYLATGDRTYTFESHYLLSYQSIDSKKYSNAKINLKSALDSYQPHNEKPLYNDVLTRLADIELMDNNYEAALSYYDRAIDNDASDADYITLQKSLIYGLHNKPYEKLNTLETLIKEDLDSPYRDDALFEIGETLVQLGNNNEAYRIYNSLAELYPQSEFSPKSHMRMGLISYNQGDMEQALMSYEKGLKSSDNNEDQRAALIAMEEIYLENLNDSDAYFRFLESEVGYEYEDIEKDSITYDVAFASYKNAEYEQAISLLEDYRRKYGDGFYKDDAAYYLAESHALLKLYDKALVHYEEVLQDFGSEHYKSSLKKSALISYNHSHDFNKAYRYYNELIDLEGSRSLELQEAALYSAFKTSNVQGVEKYGISVATHTDASDHSKGVAQYYLGKTYQSQNKLDEAMASYTMVGNYLNNNEAAEASYHLSRILYDRQQYEKAEVQAFETTKNATNYPYWVAKSLILIGDIYTVKKDFLNASAAYESVIENFKDDKQVNGEAVTKLESLNIIIEEESRIKPNGELEFIEVDSLENE